MDDLISRQAAIDAIESVPDSNWTSKRYSNEIRKLPSAQPDLTEEDMRLLKRLRTYHSGTYAKAIDHVIEKASAQHELNWIPCSERLPNNIVTVIVSIRDETGDSRFEYSAPGWITPNGEWIVGGKINYDVVAWMPLPEPWRGEEHER